MEKALELGDTVMTPDGLGVVGAFENRGKSYWIHVRVGDRLLSYCLWRQGGGTLRHNIRKVTE